MFGTYTVASKAFLSHYHVTGFAGVLQQGLLPVCVGVLTVFSLAPTSRSLRLCRCLNATMGGLGMAGLPQVCPKGRISRCFLKVLAIQERTWC